MSSIPADPVRNRFQKYRDAKLGLPDAEVALTPHHLRWKRCFSNEANILYDQLRIEPLRLYHCGSTAVPGLRAKPVIDIVGSAPSLDLLDARRGILESIGYEYKGEYGIPGRRYCVLHDPEKKTTIFHLHLFKHESPEIFRHLVLRDYLRSSPAARATYEECKTALAARKALDREKYTEGKAPCIRALLAEAESWVKPPRKVLILLGSSKGGKNTRHFVEARYPHPEVEVADLVRMEIQQYRYRKKGESAASDDFIPVIRKMIEADLVVFATPVYWYSMSGAMKHFIDRFSDLLSGDHKPLGEALYGRKILLHATGSDPRLPLGFEAPFSAMAIYFGMDYLGASYLPF